MADPAGDVAREIVDDVIARNVRVVRTNHHGWKERAQHGKSHGCVKATFAVRADVPAELAVGAFRAGANHEALLRFSSGATRDDRQRDAHGAALKLLGVAGSRLPVPGDAAAAGPAFDIILADHDTFPSFDDRHYRELNRIVCDALALVWAAKDRTWPGLPTVHDGLSAIASTLFTSEGGKLREAAGKFASQYMHSPFAAAFWSTQPFRLGERLTVRYVMRPSRRGDHARPETPPDGEHAIAAALARDVAAAARSFEFCVIRPPRYLAGATAEAIEDCRRPWACDGPGGVGDPWHADVVPVAEVRIEKGAALDPMLGDGLEFNPWRTPEAHEPLGIINRIRLLTYLRLAAERFPNA